MEPANPVVDRPSEPVTRPHVDEQERDSTQTRFRHPDNRSRDGAVLWRLARASQGLDENSEYAYHMMAEYFSDTCIIAEVDDEPAGFITGFRPPAQPDTLFVWQIAVDPRFRGRRLAIRMLLELLDRLESSDVRYLEASVTPSNAASRRTFHGVARELETWCEESSLFRADAFVSGEHEDEIRFRIGPFRPCAGGGVPVEDEPLAAAGSLPEPPEGETHA